MIIAHTPPSQSESLFLYGVMLVVTDMNIEGVVRERMLVAFHRYRYSPCCYAMLANCYATPAVEAFCDKLSSNINSLCLE